MKVLIVDDDENRANSLTRFLSHEGVTQANEITAVACANDAKQLLRNCYYDVLILDVVLPKRKNEIASHNTGLGLLSALNHSSAIFKPEKIIGLTANLEDIARYKSSFEQYCQTVIEASSASTTWKSTIATSIRYLQSSKLARVAQETPLRILTIHGIRTFGEWQVRLENIVKGRLSGIVFSSYRYGYFSAPALFISHFREAEINKLANHLSECFQENPNSQFVIYTHSFGTFLIAHALKKLVYEGKSVRVKLLVLSGSMLPQQFDWSFLQRVSGTKIVNDCADDDLILWLSEALVPNAGMAGKGGFLGIQNELLVNRFFTGGHSSYFQGDEFMTNYWLPLLNLDDPVSSVDFRRVMFWKHGIFEKVIILIGKTKSYFYRYAGVALLAVLLFFSTRVPFFQFG